ncbi:hypothetical protein SNE40_021769 [Patella caerulea]|uniref:Fibrinogen C-terminal domain-containing protein n=1 Tax=Patella caerulea TaxID=87958 RepID=A0AAN8GCX4_PATCE
MVSYSMNVYVLFIIPVFAEANLVSPYIKTKVIPELQTCTENTFNGVITHFENVSNIGCSERCSSHPICRRYMYDKESRLCTLFESGENCITHERVDNKLCYKQKSVCGATKCTRCPIGYYGEHCQHIIRDCKDGFDKELHPDRITLSYIQPVVNGPVVEAKCIFKLNGRLYIHFRKTDCLEVDFNKTFDEYANGFGNPVGNYFLGLEHIYNILQGPDRVLSIEFGLTTGLKAKGFAKKIQISSKDTGYKIYFDNFNPYSSGDSLTNLRGRPFSTFDRDNTSYICPERFGGGWWYKNDNVCSRGNINGKRVGNNFESTWHWQDDLGTNTSFSYIFMRIKVL